MRLALAQLDTVVGDFEGNLDLVLDATRRAGAAGAQLVVCPELALAGYPPRDLVERRGFVRAAKRALDRLQAALDRQGPAVLVGSIDWPSQLHLPRNVVHLVQASGVQTVAKRLLPTYDVFDEVRHFSPGLADQLATFELHGTRFGVLICEDQWTDPRLWGGHRPYPEIVAQELARAGVALVINASASPFSAGKLGVRAMLTSDNARQEGVAVALCNLVGANDSLVFDGGSLLVNADGHLAAAGASFEPDLLIADFDPATRRFEPLGDTGLEARRRAARIEPAWPEVPAMHVPQTPHELDDIEAALVAGLRGYAKKLGFRSALVGLSGGIDSALVAYLAAQALGGDAVHVVEMPSRFTADLSRTVSAELVATLGLRPEVIEIEPLQQAFLRSLASSFGDRPEGVTEENLQSRIRGTLLMALSNKRGHLLLSTGNKSEMAVGYCTLYGDMNGGLSVISDLFKLQVRALCERVNARAGRELIPRAVIERPPSAELRADQRDDDALPPYEVLDPILTGMLVDRLEDRAIAEALGVEPELVERVRKLTNRAEFKRFQAAPTLRVSPKAWHGRRYPIVHRFGSFDGTD